MGAGEHDPGLYARSFADVYDEWYGALDDPAEVTRAFVDRCAIPSTLVEFGSGTGRLAAPLSAAGFRVVGIDASLDMLRTAADSVHSIAADMISLPLRSASAAAVLVAYNTLFNLNTPRLQEQCFQESARVLLPGGLMAVEAFIAPQPKRRSAAPAFGLTTKSHPTRADGALVIITEWSTDESTDPSERPPIRGSHIELLPEATVCRPWEVAYQTPDELDRCARRAGLAPAERGADWQGSSFDPAGHRHVSWYRRDGS